jgi:hypothetical protein
MNTMSAYDADFQRWLEEQSRLLQGGQFDRLDIRHLIEELDSIGARDRRELINRLAVLIAHLLKWQFQPERRSTSWRLTINEQRRQLALIMEDSPSLRVRLPEFLSRAYTHGMRAAVDETGLPTFPFPAECPWDLSRLFDETFWPNTVPPG